ncbi:hypothetical protein ECZU22_04930 [Escherichia coli]|nr:hypothetical protein ECZU22_04930 [Escherichia coli]
MIDEYVGCIRRQQPHGPYVLAGWSYGAFLAAGAAQRLYAKGEQVRMVLIDPVCRQDFCCENRAALLRLLAEGQTPLALPEHFDQQTPDSQLADFISLAKTAGMVSQNLTLQAAETWLDNIAHLLRLLTEHTPGESVPVPCLMVYAAGRPAHWTPAETEWQGWINNADDAVIEASHWQIMMEAPRSGLCATHYALALRNLNATGEHVMMPSASPKQRVLIVGAKFGEMYLNAFMQPRRLELVGLLAQEAPVQESWLMRLAFRCIPRRNR